MTLSDQIDQASAKLKELAGRASEAEANVKAAAEKEQAELLKEVEAVEEAASQAAAQLKSSAEQSSNELTEQWNQVQSGWQQHVAKVRSDVEARRADRDAARAERHAERAEEDALAGVAFAFVALEEAEYRILDAALARLEADALAVG